MREQKEKKDQMDYICVFLLNNKGTNFTKYI
jgi:hypothetical protein